MKKLLLRFLALFFPWTIFLIEDNPGAALLAFLFQATLIGWLPATIWAWQTSSKIIARNKKNKQHKHTASNEDIDKD